MGVSELSLARKMTDLYVGNLSWETTSEGLQAHLSQYGSVVDCDTGTVRNGRTRGGAIVKMGSEADAENVIQSCHDVEFDGRPLTVRQDAKPEGAERVPGLLAERVAAAAVVAIPTWKESQRTPPGCRSSCVTFLGPSPRTCCEAPSSRLERSLPLKSSAMPIRGGPRDGAPCDSQLQKVQQMRSPASVAWNLLAGQ